MEEEALTEPAVLLWVLLRRLLDGRAVRRLLEGSLLMAEGLHAQHLWKMSCVGRREVPMTLTSVPTGHAAGQDVVRSTFVECGEGGWR